MTLQRNRQRGGFTEDEDMYRSQSNPRHCQYSRPSWDIFETSSVRDWSLPRDRLPLPKTFSLSNVYRASEGRSGTARNRSHDYEASLARAYPGARNGYCNSCSCLEIIRDEIGHYASVGTNTETDSTTETLRSSLKKVQLEKTPLHTKKDRSTRASLVMTWQAMGSDDEGRGDEEEEEEEEETNDRRDILSRPAYRAPPLSLPASSPYGRRATGRPPSTSGLRLPRSQPLKVQAHGNTTYRTLDDADQPADTAENEEIKRFEPRRESKETALRSYDFQQTSDFQEYSPSSSTRRILSTEEQEDRTFVRI
ncbi:unnamed protein product [Schistocephalus solidus]|uniref:Uncharacterized protein n=1 Tax=Schistocephalus solidus TaxID=70667 RepID=A0A183TNU6_SCHSO|nr:unnamed protein product [Schistocephalus solidus]